ncbi:MAG: alpha/beta hydrolase [Candidatus Omnitrophica bacterium]|nr:alpha/beta hydrolase [Candidatus Omnitrophota bacterium]MBU1923106.1 alpha/beta hydrolase [Candidatus Omnitrophota bacterium]
MEKVKLQTVKVDDVVLGYKIIGKGYPLVLIMGYSATMDMWDSRVLTELARRYRVIIFDNRGMGSSTATEKEFNIGLFAEDTAGLLKALKIKKANVLGFSMGTNIALEFTLRYPNMVNKLILYAGDCGGKESMQPDEQIKKQLIDTSDTPKERDMRMIELIFPVKWLQDNPDLRKCIPKVTERSHPEIIDRQTNAMTTWEGCYSRLNNLTLPVLLITGSEDVLTPPKNSLILANRIPLTWLVQIKGAGHGLMYQYPEEFVKTVFLFLQSE